MDRFDKFSQVKVLIIGDVMIDKYIWGDVSRISPEAPVPVVKLKRTNLIAGGAANVATNVAGLGATPLLVGIIGDDSEGNAFPGILSEAGISGDYLVKIRNRQTTIKTRVVAHNQQIVRVDQEITERLSENDEAEVWRRIEELIKESTIVVLSDYNKGFLNKDFTARLITFAINEHKIVLVDPKGKDYSKYKGATILTPNKYEVAEACNVELTEDTLNIAANRLASELLLDAILVTRGEEGMTLFEATKEPFHLNALARDVYDVTGAGDTVIATLSVAMGAGESFAASAEIANIAAGLVVRELGTTAIKLENLKKAFADKWDKLENHISLNTKTV